MKKALFWIAIFLLTLFAETVISPRLLPLGFRPDTVIIVIVITSMVGEWIVAGFYGAAVGFVISVLVGRYTGLEAMVYLLVAMLAGLLFKRQFSNNFLFAAIGAFAALFVKELVTAGLIQLFGGTADIGSALWMIAISGLITAVLTLPAYFFATKWSALRPRRKRYQ